MGSRKRLVVPRHPAMGNGLSRLVTLNCGNLGPAAQSLQIRSDRPKRGKKELKMDLNRRSLLALAVASAPVGSICLLGNRAVAATAEDLNRDAAQALQTLYRSNPVAVKMSKIAKAELVFPNIVKAGLIFGGAYGEGVLMEGSKVVDYYNSINGSWGLQAGAQSYGYVVFLMNDKAVSYLKKSKGWEIGVGPTVVLVNEGVAKNLSSTTLQDDAYAFIFNQQGLMASLSIEGTKISRIKR
jgi:lipid-binding SYLF domain-containing protein